MVKIICRDGSDMYIDGLLMQKLDSIVYNIHNDWDFVIIVTGDRMVRTGKSVLAMTICKYLSEKLNVRYSVDDIYFDANQMIKEAKTKPKFSINHLDEAGLELGKTQVLRKVQDDLVNYLEQCGQLNQIFILVLPDFFRLREDIAVSRSEYLINVYRKDNLIEKDVYKDGIKRKITRFERGRFEFFDRRRKQNLYDKSASTRRKNYGLVKCNLFGTFKEQYFVDEEAYRAKKMDYLIKLEEKQKEKEKGEDKNKLRNIFILKQRAKGVSAQKIKEMLYDLFEINLSLRQIYRIDINNPYTTERSNFDSDVAPDPFKNSRKSVDVVQGVSINV